MKNKSSIEKSEAFVSELKSICQDIWRKIYNGLDNESLKTIINIKFEANVDNAFRMRHGLNDKIQFIVNQPGRMLYLYDGLEIDPAHFYMRPDDYTEVPILSILHECMKQNTNRPNIMSLESPSYEKEKQG